MSVLNRAPRRWVSRAQGSGGALYARALGQVRALIDPQTLGGRVILNSGWLIGERIVRMGLAFLVTIWVIRYLGADNYGVLAYALSLTLIVDVIATFGMRSTVVRELVNEPEHEGEIIGSTLGFKMLTAFVSVAVLIGLGWVTARDSEAFPILVVLSLSLPFSALSALDLTFQASLQSQYAVAARTIGLVVALAVRVVLLLAGASLFAFAIASAFELAAVGLAFAGIYWWKRASLWSLRFSPRLALRLMSMSWPFLLSALAASIYLKVDQVMLHAFSTSREVGQYAAAARISEIWYFIPIAAASSLLPMLVLHRREDPEAYRSNLQRAFDLNAWMAISLSLSITILAVPGIALLYGADYAESADILRIHTWAAPFIFMGTVLGRALIAEDRRTFEISRHTGGALLNIALNLILIPRFGGIGAAVATVASYAFASYVACALYGPARVHLRQMTRALFWPVRLLVGRSSSPGPSSDGDRDGDGYGGGFDDDPSRSPRGRAPSEDAAHNRMEIRERDECDEAHEPARDVVTASGGRGRRRRGRRTQRRRT